MSDESDNESASTPPGVPGADEAVPVLVDLEPLAVAESDEEAADDGARPVRSTFAGNGSSASETQSPFRDAQRSSCGRRVGVIGSSRRQQPPAVAASLERAAGGLGPAGSTSREPVRFDTPMRMIKLGRDGPRSEPPPSSLDRLPSRPPAARAMMLDPPTEPNIAFDPPTEPNAAFDPLAQSIAVDLYDGPDEDVTPTTPHASGTTGARALDTAPPATVEAAAASLGARCPRFLARD